MIYNYGFIGCGNMGGALAGAIAAVNPVGSVAAVDFFPEKVQTLTKKYGVVLSNSREIASCCKFIFLAVKPQMFRSMFNEIKDTLAQRADGFVLVSIAAGVSISDVNKMAGGDYPVIRIMPNMPVSVGKGIILYAANNKVSPSDLSEFVGALSNAGMLDRIEENKIDAASAVTGCGPAFAYMFIEALADGVVECGIPRDKALIYAEKMLEGSAIMASQTEKHPELLKDEICSPAGTTIAGVHALENNGFRAAVMDAVVAAYNRTLELKA